MASTLQVLRLKPNPRGKDRARWQAPTPTQLAGEWVDVKNVGADSVDVSKIALYHRAYPAGGGEAKWAEVCKLAGTLPAGKILRVHSGRPRDGSVRSEEDTQGHDYYMFTGTDSYVWNNREGDSALLWEPAGEGRTIDFAGYDPNPPEGVVLVRSGQKLIPATATASGW